MCSLVHVWEKRDSISEGYSLSVTEKLMPLQVHFGQLSHCLLD